MNRDIIAGPKMVDLCIVDFYRIPKIKSTILRPCEIDYIGTGLGCAGPASRAAWAPGRPVCGPGIYSIFACPKIADFGLGIL